MRGKTFPGLNFRCKLFSRSRNKTCTKRIRASLVHDSGFACMHMCMSRRSRPVFKKIILSPIASPPSLDRLNISRSCKTFSLCFFFFFFARHRFQVEAAFFSSQRFVACLVSLRPKFSQEHILA